MASAGSNPAAWPPPGNDREPADLGRNFDRFTTMPEDADETDFYALPLPDFDPTDGIEDARSQLDQFVESLLLSDRWTISPDMEVWRHALKLSASERKRPGSLRGIVSEELQALVDLRNSRSDDWPHALKRHVESGTERIVQAAQEAFPEGHEARASLMSEYESLVRSARLYATRDSLYAAQVQQLEDARFEQRRLLAQAQSMVDETERNVRATRLAAGKAGTSTLAEEFNNFASRHRIAASGYRWATIVSLAAAVIIAFVFSAPALAVGDNHEWQSSAYRLAAVLGLAGLGAYLGRQAAQHRRLVDWGESIRAQALAFQAFTAQFDDDGTRHAVQLSFGQRALGAPPEAGGKNDETTGMVQTLLQSLIRERHSGSI